MDNKLIITLAAALLIGLMSWNLKTTYSMSGEIIKLQQGQITLEKQITHNTLFIQKQMKKLKRKNKKN